jgi:hypothetical protein
MSEAMRPLDATDVTGRAGGAGSDGKAELASTGSPASAAGEQEMPATAKVARRPGLVTFAADMLFLAGAFSVVWAIGTFAQPEWLRNVYDAYGFGTLSSTAWAWGILDLLVGAIAIFAGFSVLRGGAFGQVMGLSIAGLSAIRWFFFLPVVPWVAITILAIDVLVVYGLVVHSEYFDTVRLQ